MQDLDIAELESEFLNTVPDQRNVGLEITVDKDMSFRSRDEIVR